MPCSWAASECMGNLSCYVERLSHWKWPALDAVGQRRTIDVLQDQGQNAADFLESIHLRNLGMIERGQYLRFALEPREPFGIGRERLSQHLQRHVAIELPVARTIHLAHPAGSERRNDLERAQASTDDQRHWPVPTCRDYSDGDRLGIRRIPLVAHARPPVQRLPLRSRD